MIKTHKEGRRVLSIFGITSIIITILLWFIAPLIIFIFYTIALFSVTILIFRFFRIPSRNFSEQPGCVVAPADGTVVAIEEVFEKEYFQDTRLQVSIFMSIHNVHINWFPISGVISYFRYHKGKYLLARHPKSSEENERTTIAIKNKDLEILVRQIAGFVARRVICNATSGMIVRQNDELGFIKFGSRLDIFLPKDSTINVKIGDKTTGGVTCLSKF